LKVHPHSATSANSARLLPPSCSLMS
jgi:hypothetical protein